MVWTKSPTENMFLRCLSIFLFHIAHTLTNNFEPVVFVARCYIVLRVHVILNLSQTYNFILFCNLTHDFNLTKFKLTLNLNLTLTSTLNTFSLGGTTP